MTRRIAALPPFAYVAAAVALWPVIELAGARLGAGHDPIQVVWLRYAVHLLLLLAFLGVRSGWASLATRHPALQLFRGLCMFGMPVSFLLAQQRATPAWVWSVFWLMPVLVLAAARFVGERPRATHAVAAIVGWLGALAVLRPETGDVAATLLALVMAGTFAGYLLASRALAGESMAASLFYTALGALLPTTLLVVAAWRPLVPSDVLPALGLGVASLAFLFALDRAIERAPAVTVAPALVVVVIWEAVLRGAWTSAAALAGMAGIAGCVLLLHTTPGSAAAPVLEQDVR